MLISYLPKFMQDIEEIKNIMFASQPEVDNIDKNTNEILKDFFVIGSSKEATIHYEKMLDITPKLSESLEKRQYDILSIYNQTLPFTLESLIQKLDAICGKDGYKAYMIYEDFVLNIKLALNKKELFTTVDNLLERIVPVNLIINLNLDYNIWQTLKKVRWIDSSKFKWKDIKESEDIKNI